LIVISKDPLLGGSGLPTIEALGFISFIIFDTRSNSGP